MEIFTLLSVVCQLYIATFENLKRTFDIIASAIVADENLKEMLKDLFETTLLKACKVWDYIVDNHPEIVEAIKACTPSAELIDKLEEQANPLVDKITSWWNNFKQKL